MQALPAEPSVDQPQGKHAAMASLLAKITPFCPSRSNLIRPSNQSYLLH